MHEPGEPYAKWYKPDKDRQILHYLICVWNLKLSHSQMKRVEWWLGFRRGGKRGDAGQRVQGFSYARGRSKTLMDSKVSIVTSTAPYAWSLLRRVDLKHSLLKKEGKDGERKIGREEAGKKRKEWQLSEVMDMLIYLIAAII